MHSVRSRIYMLLAAASTFAVILYGKDTLKDLHGGSQRRLNGARYSQSNRGYHEEHDLLPTNWTHPSVFKTWKESAADHPPPLNPVSKDCRAFPGGRSFQRRCRRQLRHTRDSCASKQAQNNDSDDGGSGDDGSDGGVNVFTYRQDQTVAMYCSVHKAASTFWVRLFRFLHNDTGSAEPVSSPRAVSKHRTHLSSFGRSRPFALGYVTRRILRPGDEQVRFMFTRDPYHRLWSVYVDKFVLPDLFFWSHHVPTIKEKALEKSSWKYHRKPFDACARVSFEEFVDYAVGGSTSSSREDHILPVSRICDPCAFRPHFIGRVEDIGEDSRALLSRLGLDHVVPDTDFQGRTLDQIRTVTEFVYETVVERGGLRQCVSDDDVQDRLLRAFVLNGYLPPQIRHTKRPSATSSRNRLCKMMEGLYLSSNRTRAEVERQRDLFFVRAYRSLPTSLLKRVRDYYRKDFEVFGYNPEPPELFAEREFGQGREEVVDMHIGNY